MPITLPDAPDPCPEGQYVPVLNCTGTGAPTVTWVESDEIGPDFAITQNDIDAARLGSTKPDGCTCEKKLVAAFVAGYRLGKGAK